jgi:cob(I)alamin adenosyltransferase
VAIGTIDELNAVLGQVRSETLPGDIELLLASIQHDLFTLGAELAAPDPNHPHVPRIRPARIAELEAAIDEYDARLPALTAFILPSGSRAAASMHVARAVCRRAERHVVHLMRSKPAAPISDQLAIYCNRLADLLFVLARSLNAAAGLFDEHWRKPS